MFDPLSVQYLRVTASKLLEKLDKWAAGMTGLGQESTYQKRVDHDQVVSQVSPHYVHTQVGQSAEGECFGVGRMRLVVGRSGASAVNRIDQHGEQNRSTR